MWPNPSQIESIKNLFHKLCVSAIKTAPLSDKYANVGTQEKIKRYAELICGCKRRLKVKDLIHPAGLLLLHKLSCEVRKTNTLVMKFAQSM